MGTRSENSDFLLFRDQGSSAALARVFDQLAPRLLLLAGHLTSDASQAEDLVQTTFLQAMRDAAKYDGTRPVAAWLSGILNHRALDLRRRAALRSSEPLPETAAIQLDPASLAADEELIAQVSLAIDAIESPYREVLALRVVHGLTPTAIAHTLGREPATVRMQLKRGLDRLRSAIPERSALLAVLYLEPVRGLDSIKKALLSEASQVAVGSATAVSGQLVLRSVLGGIVMSKAMLVSVAAAVAAIAFISQRGGDSIEASPGVDAEAAVAILSDAPVVSDPETDSGRLARLESRERRPATEATIEQAEPPGAPLQVLVRYERDQTPAAGIGVYLRSDTRDQFGLEGRSDAAGLVEFAALPTGDSRLYVDRLEDPIPVDATSELPFEVLIPLGVHVRGHVVDLDGKPVAGASISRLNKSHHDVLQATTTADEHGRFELRDVAPGTEFMARAEGWQPSELETVRQTQGTHAELELIVGARGHHMRGSVIDAGGAPVPYAWIAIGMDEDSREALAGSTTVPGKREGHKTMDLEAFLLRADENGKFESHEVPAGFALVIARPAHENSEWIGHETCFIQFGTPEAEEVTIRLRRGATLEGVLRDTHGRPIADARIGAEWEGIPTLGQMEDDIGPFLTDRRSRTAADGSFQLRGLLAGDYDLRASGDSEWIQEERWLDESETAIWNPVVEPRGSLRVQLLDPHGSPLVGWILYATDQAGDRVSWKAFSEGTDSEGRRVIADLKSELPQQLSIYSVDEGGFFSMLPCALRSDIRLGPEELVVWLTSDELNDGHVSGRWIDSNGKAMSNKQLRLRPAGRPESVGAATDAEGAFAFDSIPPGHYQLTAGPGDQPLVTFEILPGELHQLGDIELGD